ncbi:hypothetical protein D3C80_1280490 [compost metagenome]
MQWNKPSSGCFFNQPGLRCNGCDSIGYLEAISRSLCQQFRFDRPPPQSKGIAIFRTEAAIVLVGEFIPAAWKWVYRMAEPQRFLCLNEIRIGFSKRSFIGGFPEKAAD